MGKAENEDFDTVDSCVLRKHLATVRFVRGDGHFHSRTGFEEPTGHVSRAVWLRPENTDLREAGARVISGRPEFACTSESPDDWGTMGIGAASPRARAAFV